MSNFSALKTAIQTAIKQNGNNEITGDILQDILLSIVSTLGDSAINNLETGLQNEATTRGNNDSSLQQAINDEATTRGNQDTQLGNLITGIKNNIDNGYVYAGIATPSTTPVSGKVFYIATQAGTYTNLGNTAVKPGISILKYNGSTWSNEQVNYTDGGVFDVSAYNGGATYASLEALLSAANLSTIIPSAVRNGGMSIKFVQSSDNKYVQYRYVGTSTAVADFTNIANWELDVTTKNLSEDFLGLLSEIKDYDTEVYSIQATGKFGTNASYIHAVIPVTSGEVYYLVRSRDFRIAFATSVDSSPGGDIPLVSGTSIVSIESVEQYYKLVIPEGCTYLLFNTSYEQKTRCFSHYDSIEDTFIAKSLSTINIEGRGDEQVEVYFDTLKPLNIYRVWVKNPDVSMAGITYTDYSRFRLKIEAFSNEKQFISELTNVGCNTTVLNNYYDIQVPANTSYLRIRVRCAKFATLTLMLEDISSLKDTVENLRCYGDLTELTPTIYSGLSFNADGTIVNSEYFNIYQYVIPQDKGVAFTSRMNSGFVGTPLVCYSTDGCDTTNMLCPGHLGFEYYGKSSAFNVPSEAVKLLGEKVYVPTLPDGTNYILVNVRNTINVIRRTHLYVFDKDTKFTPENYHLYKNSLNDRLSYGEPTEQTPVDTIEGYYVNTEGVLTESEMFLVRVYEIPQGGTLWFRGRINAGHSDKYLINYFSDSSLQSYLGHDFQGSDSIIVYVPSIAERDNNKLYELLVPPYITNTCYIAVNVRNTETTRNSISVVSFTSNALQYDAFNNFLTIQEIKKQRTGEDNSIDSLYNSNNWKRKVNALTKKPVNARGNEATHVDTSKPMPLSVVQFSDVHGTSKNAARVIDYCNLYSPNLIINCGDTVSDYHTDTVSSYQNIEGIENVLTVIGNHDTRTTEIVSTDLNSWTYYSGLAAYEKFFAPFISSWNVVQPENAATLGRCYYYKDFIANHVRLIVLDNMVMDPNLSHYDSSQYSWFVSVLGNVPSGYSVVCAIHFPNHGSVINSTFGNYTQKARSGDWAYTEFGRYIDAINAFKNPEREQGETDEEYENRRGKFVCWLTGHKHSSVLGYAGDTNDQLVIAVGSTIEDARSGYPRITDTPSQDFFHHISIDPNTFTLKIVQVGVNYDRYMRYRNVLCYNYQDNELIN